MVDWADESSESTSQFDGDQWFCSSEMHLEEGSTLKNPDLPLMSSVYHSGWDSSRLQHIMSKVKEIAEHTHANNSASELLFMIRTQLDLDSPTLSKLRMYPHDGVIPKMIHLLESISSIAVMLSFIQSEYPNATDIHVFDIESVVCPWLRGNYDVLYKMMLEGVPSFVCVDFTLAKNENVVKLKITNLPRNSYEFTGSQVAMYVFQPTQAFHSGPIIDDFFDRVYKNLPECSKELETTSKLSRMIAYSENKQAISNSLHEIMDPLYREKLRQCYHSSHDLQPQRSECASVIDHFEEDFLKRIMHENYPGKTKDFRKVYEAVKVLSPNFLAPRWKEHLESISLKTLKSSIDLPFTTSSALPDELQNTQAEVMAYEPAFYAIWKAHNDPPVGNVNSIWPLKVDGTWGDDIDVPPNLLIGNKQTLQTPFKHNVIAYVKLIKKPRYEHITADGKTLFYTKEDRVQALHGKDYKTKLETWEGAQLLLNPNLYCEENFIKYLSRNMTEPANEERDMVQDDENFLTHSEKSEELLYPLCSAQNPEWDAKTVEKPYSISFHGKLDMLMMHKAPNVVNHLSQMKSRHFSSPVAHRLYGRYERAQAITSAMRIKPPCNYMVIRNCLPSNTFILYCVNSDVKNFRTSWYKSISLALPTHVPFNKAGRIWQSKRFTPVNSNDGKIQFDLQYKDIGDTSVLVDEPQESGQYCIYATQWCSIDKNHLVWDLNAYPRALSTLASLTEYRHHLYKDDESLAKEEQSYFLLDYFVNRQQFSVIMNAQRYLHSSLSSANAKMGAPIDKLNKLSIKYYEEMLLTSNMLITYMVGSLYWYSKRASLIRSKNSSVFTVMPNLLRASNNPHLNVSCYSIYALLNPNKSWRTASESECVRAVWEQKDKLKASKEEHEEFYQGLPNSFKHSLDLETFNPRVDYSDRLVHLIERHSEDIYRFSEEAYDYDNQKDFVSNTLFQVMTLLDVRNSYGACDSLADLSMEEISKHFTTRGSFTENNFNELRHVKSNRKASALFWLVEQLELGFSRELPECGETSNCIDPLTLVLGFMLGKLKVDPLIQLSEKDAPGKDREISTLHVSYGMLCLVTELMAAPLSKRVPEDIVTEKDKTKSTMFLIEGSQRSKAFKKRAEKRTIYYASTDKSRFGPNIKNSSWLIACASLCSDKMTYPVYELCVRNSESKQVRYPHNILKESLNVSGYKKGMALSETKLRKSPPATGLSAAGRKGEVQNKIFRQYMYGNEYGSAGTTHTHWSEGMPGQGIFTTTCSLGHTAIMRYISKICQEVLEWEVGSIVTSDDSMAVISVPDSDSDKAKSVYPSFSASLLSMGGLIENMGKYILSSNQAEMNSLYCVRGEPSVPTFKFTCALTQTKVTANVTNDMVEAVSSGAELMRKGASLFTATHTVAVNMVLVLDTHQMWGPYFKDHFDIVQKGRPYSATLWSNPVELLGIPVMDVFTAMLTGMGPRVNSMLPQLIDSETRSLDDRLLDKYSKLIALDALKLPNAEIEEVGDMPRDLLNEDGYEVAQLYDGEGNLIHVPLVKHTYFPTISGLKGTLRKLESDIKVSKELGPNVVKYEDFNPNPRSISSLISTVKQNLAKPIRGGTQKPDPMQDRYSLNHSHDFQYLKFEGNSPMNPDNDKEVHLSKKDLILTLANEDLMVSKKLYFLKNLDEIGLEEIDDWRKALVSSLSELVRQTVTISFHIMYTSQHIHSFDDKESDFEGLLSPDVRKRYIQLMSQINTNLSHTEIKRHIFSQLADPDMIMDAPLSLQSEYGSLVTVPSGNLEWKEAIEKCEMSTERILSRLPTPTNAFANIPINCTTPEEHINSFIRYNSHLNFKLRIPHLSETVLRPFESYNHSWQSREEMQVSKLFHQENLNEALNSIIKGAPVRPFRNTTKIKPLSVYKPGVLSEPALQFSLFGPRTSDVDLLAGLSSVSNVVTIPGNDFMERLSKSAHIGWVGDPFKRCKVRKEETTIKSLDDYTKALVVTKDYLYQKEGRRPEHLYAHVVLSNIQDYRVKRTVFVKAGMDDYISYDLHCRDIFDRGPAKSYDKSGNNRVSCYFKGVSGGVTGNVTMIGLYYCFSFKIAEEKFFFPLAPVVMSSIMVKNCNLRASARPYPYRPPVGEGELSLISTLKQVLSSPRMGRLELAKYWTPMAASLEDYREKRQYREIMLVYRHYLKCFNTNGAWKPPWIEKDMSLSEVISEEDLGDNLEGLIPALHLESEAPLNSIKRTENLYQYLSKLDVNWSQWPTYMEFLAGGLEMMTECIPKLWKSSDIAETFGKRSEVRRKVSVGYKWDLMGSEPTKVVEIQKKEVPHQDIIPGTIGSALASFKPAVREEVKEVEKPAEVQGYFYRLLEGLSVDHMEEVVPDWAVGYRKQNESP